mgnify:CR=1 FL=1
MILKGKIVTLRPVESSDIEFIRGIINDPVMESTIIGWAWPLSQKDQEKWYANFSNSDKSVRYIIETEADGCIGFTGLRDIDWKNGCATTAGMRIARKVRSRGIGTDTYMTMFNFAFNELRLHRISASSFEDNVASLRMLEKVGCHREGIRRECVFKQGKYHNVVLMGILDSDYKDLVARNGYWDNKDCDTDELKGKCPKMTSSPKE